MELFEDIYTNNFNSFEQWLKLINDNQFVYPRFRIPYSQWVEDYINNIENRSESDVKSLLRYLLFPFSREIDEYIYNDFNMLTQRIKNKNIPKEIYDILKKDLEKIDRVEKNRRVLNRQEAWEGLTWVLQLLPYKPYKAIKALNSYIEAEIMYMPDDRIIGINQCISIIEAKFIHTNKGLENYILNLNPREFELLIGRLYENLGFDVEITPATRDGGKDIIAQINREDGKEIVYVECKLYKTTELSKTSVRAFGYSIFKDNINRGVLFCTGYVNEELRVLDNRIQIWTIEEIMVLLNAHLGTDWNRRLNRLINSNKGKSKNKKWKY